MGSSVMTVSQSTLHILMVTPRSYPYQGGIETHIYETSRRLVQRGIKVTVLSTIKGNQSEFEYADGVRIIRVPAYPHERDFYFSPHILQIITSQKWSLIHCQGIHTFVPPIAMLAALWARIPYILTLHSGGHSSAVRNAMRPLQWRMLQPLLTRARMLIGVSQFEAEHYSRELHIPESKFTVIPNGGTLPIVPETSSMSFGYIPTDAELIVSPGRLERYKGHHRLIDALPYILRQHPRAHLLILGSGPYEKALHERARALEMSDHVTIRSIPPQKREEMAGVLAHAQVVALLSEYESQGIGISEALALRRPVLVTAASALQEFVDRGEARAILLNSAPEAIATAVVRELEHPLFPSITTLPTWDNCADSLLELYRSLMDTNAFYRAALNGIEGRAIPAKLT
jgi:glycosyltransferase involved in cell wall biosynthesis